MYNPSQPTLNYYKHSPESLLSLAILHLPFIKIYLIKIPAVVSTCSYQKQHQLKYLTWLSQWNETALESDSGQILDIHQKGGSCLTSLAVKTLCRSHVNLFAVCVEKTQTKQLRQMNVHTDLHSNMLLQNIQSVSARITTWRWEG